MKIITCDLCKREIGRQVDVGNFIGWGSGTNYRPSDFILSMPSGNSKTISDLCSECFIEIAKAQNEIIEKLRNKLN